MAEAAESISVGSAAPLSGGGRPEPVSDQPGSRALLDQAAIPHERAPMLDQVFRHLPATLKPRLRALANEDVDVTLVESGSVRFGPYLAGLERPAMLAIVKAEAWGGQWMISLGADLIYALVELSLGGRPGGRDPAAEGRGFTAIETRIARRLFDLVLAEVQTAFGSITPVRFSIDLIETNPRFAAIAGATSLAALATFKLDLGAASGQFQIVIPHPTLEPVRDLLLADPSGDKLGRDDIWSAHLASQVALADATLSAVLYEGKMPLGRIMKLGVGDTLMFTTRPDDAIDLRCGHVVLGRGRLGRVDNNIALKVEAMQLPDRREGER